MGGREVVLALWDHIEARDWGALRSLLCEDVVVDWPVSRERIIGPENFVAVNAEYPEGWSINVRSVVGSGERVASEVWVPHERLGLFAVTSFWHVDAGRIRHGVEYWTEPGADARPAWREPYAELLDLEELQA